MQKGNEEATALRVFRWPRRGRQGNRIRAMCVETNCRWIELRPCQTSELGFPDFRINSITMLPRSVPAVLFSRCTRRSLNSFTEYTVKI